MRGVRLQLFSDVEVTVLSTLVDASQHLIRFGLLRQVVQLVDELGSRDVALLAAVDELKQVLKFGNFQLRDLSVRESLSELLSVDKAFFQVV